MYILGINAYHGDASAALLHDGTLLAAIEEERLNRVKHWAGFPSKSIRFCLDEADIEISDIDHIAISFNPKANLLRRAAFVATHWPSPRAIIDRVKRQSKTLGLEDQLAAGLGVSKKDIQAKIHRVEHHQTHVAAGFLMSPFDNAAVLSIDGMGDFTSTLTAAASGNSWNEFDRVFFPHSIGLFYSAMTMYLGFPHYGDEYKVMGLAPYGRPEYVDEIRKIIKPRDNTFELDLQYFEHHRRGIRMDWNNGAPLVKPFYSHQLERLLGPARLKKEPVTERHENIARSVQHVTEEIIIHLLNRLHEKTRTERLCMTGGVAMNSVANGKITTNTPFDDVYIPAGAADNGTSIGGAFYVWNHLLKNPRTFVQTHAYWGSDTRDEDAVAAATTIGVPFEHLDTEQLLDRVVDLLISGNVVGWFQGRMEFGARALGNRSLLADPRRTDMRDIINLRIKFREKFRPFAPSILEEHAADWFESAEPTPYMEKVLPIRAARHDQIPAVTHVDGSGRLQTVSPESNPLYHRLIQRFYERTGVPIILNTSLNENEPIVSTPDEAVQCFLRTDMDAIAIGNVVINRHHAEFPMALKSQTRKAA